MDKSYINDMLETLFDNIEDIRLMVADLVSAKVCDIESEIEGNWKQKGIINYIQDALKYIKCIQQEVDKDDEI